MLSSKVRGRVSLDMLDGLGWERLANTSPGRGAEFLSFAEYVDKY